MRRRRARPRLQAFAAAALAFFATSRIQAAEPAESTTAKTYYDAGVQAYSAGRYAVAVEAFTAAYDLANKPTLLFSLAQAERRQYTVSRDAKTLRSAIAHFRKYLDEVKEGGRRADAVEALGELSAVAARVDPATAPENGDKPPPTSRILITTEAKGATVYLDGAAHAESPVVEQVAPGAHTVRVTAPGCVDEVRQVVTVEGTILPLEITLRERPSFVAVMAPVGSKVMLDGRAAGESPLDQDIQVTSGAHVVAVTKPGRTPYQERLFVTAGETLPVRVTLKLTPQRISSYAIFASAGVSILAGGALGLVAFDAESTAKQILSTASQRSLSQPELDTYNGALERRDDSRVASLSLLGAGAALGLTAAALYLFDNAEPPPLREPAVRDATDPPRVSFTFGVTPTAASFGLTGSF
ncbi:MAG: PEGA domain-containing protein [Polyangiaceae bacterium]